ncbi:YdeI/OmpD-associated family protein [Actinomycetospora termitidis]|uniref:YdeI/OmpD-associated family protein n=1 Tax=Actinomycetospora termitidis TaxID=3053470 RepID=A0ABT7MH63_9PSEU|nr:YdeI/OmpD-associated family protein [Actinomycetospora sp. Odt1-22]MDL5160026.1 YdeI/OmpD-associated family protein [Actinomycetospora sp. Odt1-22]
MSVEQPELVVADADAWRAWLGVNHDDPVGVWLVLAKKAGLAVADPETTLTYAQALDEALCFGWIDGQAKRRDDLTSFQRFTPRRARSPWSTRNVSHVARLSEEGRMHAAGLAEVERAKTDGRWDAAYAGPATATVPEDLATALAASPAAAAMFETLTSQNRFALTHRLGQLKRAETRARRVAEYVAMLERGETIYPQKR